MSRAEYHARASLLLSDLAEHMAQNGQDERSRQAFLLEAVVAMAGSEAEVGPPGSQQCHDRMAALCLALVMTVIEGWDAP
jgi:hypothetical protein